MGKSARKLNWRCSNLQILEPQDVPSTPKSHASRCLGSKASLTCAHSTLESAHKQCIRSGSVSPQHLAVHKRSQMLLSLRSRFAGQLLWDKPGEVCTLYIDRPTRTRQPPAIASRSYYRIVVSSMVQVATHCLHGMLLDPLGAFGGSWLECGESPHLSRDRCRNSHGCTSTSRKRRPIHNAHRNKEINHGLPVMSMSWTVGPTALQLDISAIPYSG